LTKNIEEFYCERTQLADNSAEMEAKDKLIAEKIWERNRAVIVEQISEMSDASCNLSRVKMWKIKKKICPKNEVTPPVAKFWKSGYNQDQLKALYINTYKDRLRHRDMNPNICYLRDLKEFLFRERFQLSKLRKSEEWTAENLLQVQKSLKMRKSADPSGLINELFKPGVAGLDVNK
jgi:hypothetical protein